MGRTRSFQVRRAGSNPAGGAMSKDLYDAESIEELCDLFIAQAWKEGYHPHHLWYSGAPCDLCDFMDAYAKLKETS